MAEDIIDPCSLAAAAAVSIVTWYGKWQQSGNRFWSETTASKKIPATLSQYITSKINSMHWKTLIPEIITVSETHSL